MKPAVKPEDIALPDWLQRIGKERISRIQVGLARIHNSLLGRAVWKYVPFQRAFDVIAIELCNDPQFGRFYFHIRSVVIDLANELGWIRPEWLTPFDPSEAFPMISWEASILPTLSGKRWSGAYVGESHHRALTQGDNRLGTPKETASSGRSKPAASKAKARRLMRIRTYCNDHDLTMSDFARHFGVSLTAIYGMVNGDRTRYSEGKLKAFLKKFGVSQDQW